MGLPVKVKMKIRTRAIIRVGVRVTARARTRVRVSVRGEALGYLEETHECFAAHLEHLPVILCHHLHLC